mmetsp:Transcript_22461/g.42183  ORF Transcript_22461/g.42183 Transcript_22461/m.42183 type:complete len:84 (-) Transcript_22461:466-717(-)
MELNVSACSFAANRLGFIDSSVGHFFALKLVSVLEGFVNPGAEVPVQQIAFAYVAGPPAWGQRANSPDLISTIDDVEKKEPIK